MIHCYKYGLLPPTANEALVREQFWKAHQYQNDLIAIERAKRERYRHVRDSIADFPELEKKLRVASERLEQLEATAAEQRQVDRTRTTDRELAKSIKQAKNDRRDAYKALVEAKKSLKNDPAMKRENDELKKKASQLAKSARELYSRYNGLYSGTYQRVEKAHQQARKAPHLKFARWRDKKRHGIRVEQPPSGFSVEEIFDGSNSKIRITSKPRMRKSGTYSTDEYELSFRVASNGYGGSPVWATFPMKYHKPLPVGSRIKEAVVTCERFRQREEWNIIFTVEESDRVRESIKGTIAIDVGWRQMPDGSLRVATLFDGSKIEEVRLSPTTIAAIHKAEDLRSIRDKKFDIARKQLDLHLDGLTLPKWFSDRVRNLAKWRSPEALAALIRDWKNSRFDNDTTAYEAAEAWRYDDHHIAEWEANQRRSALRRRREQYRMLAARLAKQYKTCALEKFNLSTMARVDPTNQRLSHATARSNRVLAAVSELRNALENAFGKENIIEVSSAYTSQDCAQCGTRGQRSELSFTCSSCGATDDADANGAKNIHKRSSGVKNAVGTHEPKIVEKKWSRLKREKKAKSLQKEAVENPVVST